MDPIFNFIRCKLFIQRIISERGMKLFGSLLFILFCMILFLGIGYIKPSIYETARSFFVAIGLFLGPIIYTWVLASEYQTNSQSISFLMLPNSTFERWLTHTFIGVGVYFIIFIGFFRILDVLFVKALHLKYDDTGIAYIIKDLQIQPFDSILLYGPLLLGIITSLSVLIGTLYFRKNSIVYSLFTLFLCVTSVIIYHFIVINLSLEGTIPMDGRSAIPFYRVLITDNINPTREYIIGSKYSIGTVLTALCIPIICTLKLTYYYALKEKQL
jgi:hypothetical protein